MTILSQRDLRWASIKLGFSTMKITSNSSVYRLVSKIVNHFKVFKSVVQSVPINVVDDVTSGEQPAKVFTHNHPVFIGVSLAIGHWVISNKYFRIPIPINGFSSVPSMIGFPKMNGGNAFVGLSFIRTLTATKLLIKRWIGIKFNPTKLTLFTNHLQSDYIGLE